MPRNIDPCDYISPDDPINGLRAYRDALAIVRDALGRADDYGKRDLWRVEYYLCTRCEQECRRIIQMIPIPEGGQRD